MEIGVTNPVCFLLPFYFNLMSSNKLAYAIFLNKFHNEHINMELICVPFHLGTIAYIVECSMENSITLGGAIY